MRKHILRPLLIMLGCAALGACADDDYTELNKGEAELALTASGEEITLNEAKHAENALTLTWTTGTNHGTGNRITYKLELAEAGTGFADPYTAADGMTQQTRGRPRPSSSTRCCAATSARKPATATP